MTTVEEYTITKPLDEDATAALDRGLRTLDGAPVIVKTLRADTPTPRQVERLQREHVITSQLDSPYVIKPYALETHGARVRLILEDFGGQPLAGLLGAPLEIGLFLDIATQLAGALADIHRQGVVHKDIKPANILVHPQSGAVKLTGFGIAAHLGRLPALPGGAELIEGSLAYMSPEQTGRMNRGIDHRSDLYSLGVSFYEMLTGRLPFAAADPLEWVHCHIARQPPSPQVVIPAIPEPLGAIVMKLLAKQAEDRYQSARGLRFDLERCREQWQPAGRIEPFPLGDHDHSDRFMIPQQLYGREEQVAALLHAFEQVVATGQAALLLVSGYSGIGKSALVRELHQPIVRERGYFISSKFDQYQRDVPYATIVQAFGELIQQILAESEERIERWKAELQQALGANGQLIVEIIPQVELIIGPQPAVPELPPTEAQQRFHRVFQKFMGVFARQDHPLALFLDDLQWLDPASLTLIAYLMSHPDTRYLLLLGAYRDNEVSPSHPLLRTLEAIHQGNTLVEVIVLGPLTCRHVTQLVAETVHRPARAAASLARLVYDKTAGNPFFAIQFLTTLYQEDLLAYDERKMHWRWDLPAIRRQGFTDNVVELMLGKLQRFSAATREAMQLAACLGNTAETATLALIRDWPEDQLHAALREADDEGLLLRQNGSYKFLHDRVQEAAYALLPEQQRAAQHVWIGRQLLAHTPEERLAERIFAIVGQLNRGASLIASREERERLAELNLIAGKRAKAATAFASALTYLTAGTALLAEDCWERQHELTFTLELCRAECEFLTGALTEAEERLAALSTRAATTIERASVACLRVDLYTTLGQSSRAIAVGLDYLQHLGVEWSPHPTDEDVRREYQRIWSQLGSRTTEDLIELPLMTDPASLATMDVLTKIGPPAFFTEANLYALAICWAVNLSLERGNSDGSCDAYVRLGLLAGELFDDYKAGFRFGEVGYELIERRGLKRFQARIYMLFGAHLIPCARHIQAGRDLLRRGFKIANESGDLVFAACCCFNLNENLLAAGDPLIEVQREAEHGLAFAQRVQFGHVIDTITSDLGFVRTLRGLTRKFGSFDDEHFDERRIEEHFSSNPNLAMAECWYWIRKLQAHFHAGDYASAVNASSRAQQPYAMSRLLFTAADYHFYSALSHAASCISVVAGERQQHVDALAAHHKQLQVWAENCPENFADRAALVGAEIARIEGRGLDAERLYELAIRSAYEHRFTQNEALAYELAAQFYRARSLTRIADMYLREARACYARWGADGKVKQLDQRYPKLVEPQPLAPAATFAGRPEQLDLLAAIKASQSISREILLPDLLEALLRVVLEQAGAQRAFLLLADGERLAIHAQAEIVGAATRVNLAPALPVSAATLPIAILNYVRRTGESLVLIDAAAEDSYALDEYIARRQPRSILCLPIRRQAQLVGLLYLENNLAAGAFSTQTLTVLELLAAQAAISLESARLYEELRTHRERLEELVAERTAELALARDAAQAANQAKSQFLAMMSHELRTPLNGILGFAQILSRTGGLSTGQAHGLQIIEQSGEHLLTLINDILDLAKIEAGKFELAPTDLYLPTFLRDIVEICRLRTEQKGLSFAYEAAADLPTGIRADQQRLRQVLLNLLGNAIKFTERGRVTFRVSVVSGQLSVAADFYQAEGNGQRTTDNGQLTLRFAVEDTGPGIAPHHLEAIFRPFEQVGPAHQRVEGTGLGLAISQRLLELMGSAIQVESQLGAGSKFWFELLAPVVADVATAPLSLDSQISGYSGPRRTILVVDDKPHNRAMLVELLAPLGFELSEAADGRAAVAQAQALRPDLVLMDLRLPLMSGLEATRAIRQLSELQGVVIIATSASVFEADRRQSLLSGCNAFIPKPIRVPQLLELIATQLGLTWRYAEEGPISAPTNTAEVDALVPPPAAELAILYELALSGDILGLQARAAELTQGDPALRPFAQCLADWAGRFELEQALALIARYRPPEAR